MATKATVTFDDKPVGIFRTKSPVFSYTVAADHSIYDFLGLFGPQFEGTISPAVADGYWAFIPAPSSGSHVVHIVGENSAGFSLDVTYILTIP